MAAWWRACGALGAVGALLCLLPLWGVTGPHQRGRANIGVGTPQVKDEMLQVGDMEVDDGLIVAGLGAAAVGGGLLAAQQAGLLNGLPGWPSLPGLQGGGSRPGNYAHYVADESVAEDFEVDYVWSEAPKPDGTAPVGVFGAMQFELEAGSGGYMGMQVASSGASDIFGIEVDGGTTHKAIFSYWDLDPSHRIAWLGPSCSRFGGEGTGSHCQIPYKFREGEKYTMRLKLYGYDEHYSALVGDIVDAGTGESTDIGTLLLPTTKDTQGFGRFKARGGSFLEYFSGTGCDHQARASVGLVGPFFAQRSRFPSKAVAAYAKGCRWSDVSACIAGEGCGAPHVLLTGGGTTDRTTQEGQELWGTGAASPQATAAPQGGAGAAQAAAAEDSPAAAGEGAATAPGPAPAATSGHSAHKAHRPSLGGLLGRLAGLVPVDGGAGPAAARGGPATIPVDGGAAPTAGRAYEGPWKFTQLPEKYQTQIRGAH